MGGRPAPILSPSPRNHSLCWSAPLDFSPVVHRPWVLALGKAHIWVDPVVTTADLGVPPSKSPHTQSTGSANGVPFPLQTCSLHVQLGVKCPQPILSTLSQKPHLIPFLSCVFPIPLGTL